MLSYCYSHLFHFVVVAAVAAAADSVVVAAAAVELVSFPSLTLIATSSWVENVSSSISDRNQSTT